MLRNTKLRTKLGAIAAPPMLVLALVASYGAYVTFLQNSLSAAELRSDLRLISILALVGMISSILAVFAMRKRIMAPIEEVTAGAVEIAENRLPVLIEGLRNPSAEIPEFDPIPFDQGNELGALASALNQVQVSAAEISAEQKNIFKRGINDLVVNLARRNQSLLDRQIESIDRLESDEEDPDRLEQLFSLDHLATRMRRNAESLLVLAGSEPARRRGGPVSLADVLRVAMSEIEDYRKVQLSDMEHAEIGAQSAVDLAHLMSELMENATQFSPPDTVVEVKGAMDEAGAYVIGIIDHGIGMNDEQLLAANELLRNPPDLGIATTRSLGFLVIGQLSKRLGVGVELVKTAGAGTTGIVVVPAHLLAGGQRRSVQELQIETPAAMTPAASAAVIPGTEQSAPASWDQPAPAEFEAPADQAAAPQGWDQPTPSPTFEATATTQAPSFESPPAPAAPTGWDQPTPEPSVGAQVPQGWDQPSAAPAGFEAPSELQVPAGWDQPAPEAPAFEEPAFEAPAFEAPAFEAPAFEEPAFEAPAFEEPAFEAPAFEEPAPEAPAFEEPAFEAPAFEEPAFEAPAFEEPAFEQSAPAFEAPAFDAPSAEPVWEQPEPAAQPVESAPSADYIPGWDDPLPEPEQSQPPAHSDSVAAAFQTPVPGQFAPPSRLEQAIPTGGLIRGRSSGTARASGSHRCWACSTRSQYKSGPHF